MKAPLGDVLVAKEFLDIVSLDIVGPLPVTERGHRYLLTFVDHFTRFVRLYLLLDKIPKL